MASAAMLMNSLLSADESMPSQTDESVTEVLTPSAMLVQVSRVERQSGYAMEQVFIGRVEARRSAELGFERAGQLIAVEVREGDRVRQGDLLARLDRSLLEARRTELRAELASAEADLTFAEVTAERYLSSVKDGAVTRQDVDESNARARAARARLALAQARIASVELDLAKTELRAPFAGTLVRRAADEGTVLNAGQTVLSLQEDAAVEIRVGVAGPLLAALEPGQRYQLESEGQAIEARLRAIIPLRTGASRTVDALFDPMTDRVPDAITDGRHDAIPDLVSDPVSDPTQEPILRPGNLVELRLRKPVVADGLWLPLAALSEGDRGLWRALVAEPDSDAADAAEAAEAANPADASEPLWQLVSRPLQVLYVDGERAYVQGPLKTGELVVTAGLQRLVPGQQVRVKQAADVANRGRLD
jgi:RND family efflux transporter MFP subunit